MGLIDRRTIDKGSSSNSVDESPHMLRGHGAPEKLFQRSGLIH